MHSSATNSSRPDAPRAVVDDELIEFAEFTAEDSLEAVAEKTSEPAVAVPSWFQRRSAAPQVHSDASSNTPDPTVKSEAGRRSDDCLNVPSIRPQKPTAPSRAPVATTSEVAVARRRKRPPESSSRETSPAASPLTGWAQWRQAIRKAVIGAYGTSLLIHVLVLVVLSAILIQQKLPPEVLSTQLSDADGVPEQFDGLVELSLPKAGADLSKALLMPPTPFADPRLMVVPDVVANVAQVAGKENGSSEFGDSDGFQFKMPTGGRAVSKGSFAAWTVPADPKPREDYLIIIRIKLPPSLKTYRAQDITGEVTGTDGFRLTVPFDARRPDATRTEKNGNVVPLKLNDLLKIVDGHAQIVVSIPGAAALVKDSIRVKSKLLKEEQRLEIEF